MKKWIVLLILSLIFNACSSSRNIIFTRNNDQKKIDKIVTNALKYEGVKYKYGGTNSEGMDCSGVVFVAFKRESILLPRVSKNMAKEGKQISLKNAKKGDLLFFVINNKNKIIDHVGLITEIKNNEIFFIHATTKRGVIVSSIAESYWDKTFVKAVTFF